MTRRDDLKVELADQAVHDAAVFGMLEPVQPDDISFDALVRKAARELVTERMKRGED